MSCKKRMTDEELAQEAACWVDDETDWEDAPERIPRTKESTTLDIKMPQIMAKILKEFARREEINVDVLINNWLSDRIRTESAIFWKRNE